MEEKEKPGPWDTITGLPNDFDGWIANPRFGFKEEYTAVAGTESPQFIIDLVNAEGEFLASQAYSCGGGWTAQDGGARISHPLRENIVSSAIYGQLLTKVIRDLAVDMSKYGESALIAKPWDGLGFHWMLEEHTTLKEGEMKQALMPTEFLGERAGKAAAAPKTKVEGDIEKSLTTLAKSLDLSAFQKAALKVSGVTDSDELMASILDEGDSGYWATHKG